MNRLWERAILATLLLCNLGFADQIIVVSGLATLDSTNDEYLFAPSRYSEPTLAFTDPEDQIATTFDLDNLTLTLEFTNLPSVSDSSLPLFTLLSTRPPPANTPLNNPSLHAGPDNGLYPSLDEPLPTALGNFDANGSTTSPTDSDGDGTPDDQDAFPNDPNEDTDTDGDSIGNNADPDDDNDLIPDNYELANNLNPLLDDSSGDRDHDGQDNLSEYIAGTLANDPSSVLALIPVPLSAKPSFQIDVVAGRTYKLFASNNLSNLLPYGTPFVATTNDTRTITPPENQNHFYFQIHVELTNP